MAEYIRMTDLKSIRVRWYVGVHAFAEDIGISSRTVQMIEKNESVNIEKLRVYIDGLNRLSNKEYKVIISAKKTT